MRRDVVDLHPDAVDHPRRRVHLSGRLALLAQALGVHVRRARLAEHDQAGAESVDVPDLAVLLDLVDFLEAERAMKLCERP
jgi:hypothetical protein